MPHESLTRREVGRRYEAIHYGNTQRDLERTDKPISEIEWGKKSIFLVDLWLLTIRLKVFSPDDSCWTGLIAQVDSDQL